GAATCDEARRLLDLGRRCDLRLGNARCSGDLGRIRATVAGNQRHDPLAAAVEDERLDDLAELAADRASGVGARRRPLRDLLDPRLDAHLAQELGNALDWLRPGTAHPRRAEWRRRRPCRTRTGTTHTP